MKNSIIRNNRIKHLIMLVAWLLIWQIAALIIDNELLFPSFVETIKAAGNLFQESYFYLDCLTTVFRCVLVIAGALVLGLGLAYLSMKSQLIKAILRVPVNFFKTVPIMAIIIYLIIVVPSGFVAVLVAFLMCFPVVYTNVLIALENIDQGLIEVTQVFKLSQIQMIKYLYFPSIKPAINSSISLICGLSWKAIIAAEVLSIPKFSLGYQMMNAKLYLNTSQLFAYILIIIILSMAMEKIVGVLIHNKEPDCYKKSKIHTLNNSCNSTKKLDKIHIEDVTKSFADKLIFKDFSITIKEYETLGIYAPSGTGKTTLIRMISGLEKYDNGKIEFYGEPEYSILFQEDRLFPWLNVYDNIKLGLIGKNKSIGSTLDVHKEVLRISEMLYLDDVLYSMPSSLSGGMQHRVALGRTFISPCNFIIFDEPFRGLDGDLKNNIITNLWKEKTNNKIVLVISHEYNDLKNLCNRIIEL